MKREMGVEIKLGASNLRDRRLGSKKDLHCRGGSGIAKNQQWFSQNILGGR